MKSQQRLGSATHATFIGMYVLTWFFWTWEAGTLPTRSDHQSWLGFESASTTWNRNKLHTQCGHYSRTTSKAWTGSRPFVSESVGPNDEYHDEFWGSLSTAEGKKCLSISYGILQRQLYDSHDEETAGLLLQCSFEALSRHHCQVQLVHRLTQPLSTI